MGKVSGVGGVSGVGVVSRVCRSSAVCMVLGVGGVSATATVETEKGWDLVQESGAALRPGERDMSYESCRIQM